MFLDSQNLGYLYFVFDLLLRVMVTEALGRGSSGVGTPILGHSLLSNVLDHQVAACVKTDFLSIFLYILIMFEWQIHKDGLSKLNFR